MPTTVDACFEFLRGVVETLGCVVEDAARGGWQVLSAVTAWVAGFVAERAKRAAWRDCGHRFSINDALGAILALVVIGWGVAWYARYFGEVAGGVAALMATVAATVGSRSLGAFAAFLCRFLTGMYNEPPAATAPTGAATHAAPAAPAPPTIP